MPVVFRDPKGNVESSEFEGAVLETRERNYYDDSDFYAVVWNEETGKVEQRDYATTRAWTYNNGATVDATDDVRAKAAGWARLQYACRLMAADREQAAVPEKGRRVKVVRGRKIPKGTEGVVFWYGEGRDFSYAPRRYRRPPLRVGIMLDDGSKVFTAASNVEVINPDQFMMPVEEFTRRVQSKEFYSYAAPEVVGSSGLAFV